MVDEVGLRGEVLAVVAQEDLRQPVCRWVELCFHLFGCLAWVIPAYRLLGGARSWWKNGSLQEGSHAYEYSPELLLRVSLSPQWATIPTPPHHLHRKPSDSSRQVWPALVRSLFYPGSWGTWVLCFPPRMEFGLPQSCGILHNQNKVFKARCSQAPLPNARPRLWSLTEDSEVSLLWENLCITIIFYFCESPTQAGMEFDFDCNCAPVLPSCCGIYICLWS